MGVVAENLECGGLKWPFVVALRARESRCFPGASIKAIRSRMGDGAVAAIHPHGATAGGSQGCLTYTIQFQELIPKSWRATHVLYFDCEMV